jgi:hypothetical protein
VSHYLNQGKRDLTAESVEVESGRRRDRPQLKAALSACKPVAPMVERGYREGTKFQ